MERAENTRVAILEIDENLQSRISVGETRERVRISLVKRSR